MRFVRAEKVVAATVNAMHEILQKEPAQKENSAPAYII
jgi:hypothetical protein